MTHGDGNEGIQGEYRTVSFTRRRLLAPRELVASTTWFISYLFTASQIQGTSAPRERFFSLAGTVFTARRAGMDPSKLRILVLLANWNLSYNEELLLDFDID